MKITGRVDAKIITQGQKDGKPWERCEFTINKMRYSTFKDAIYKPINEGDEVDVELSQNGKYWNIVSMTKVQPQASNAQNQTLAGYTLSLQEIAAQLKRVADALEKKNG